MGVRGPASIAVVVLGAGILIGPAQASAEPSPATSAPGTGPCASDPPPNHEAVVPKTLEVPVPYPAVTAGGQPSQAPATRTDTALPANPCTNPCPDLTDGPPPQPGLLGRLGLPDVLIKPKPFYFAFPGPAQPGPPPPPPVQPPVQP
ncbi:MAG: carbohydrate-binding protein, partial [Nocardia sp.]|nr:carbohydrate-binding protein [Nocardia sp.]